MEAVKLVSVQNMTRDEWLEWRRKGIGGSETAAICGYSQWFSPMSVYLDKIGKLPPKEETPKLKAGIRLEPAIADWFVDETGIRVRKVNFMLRHPKYEFMLANVDRWIMGENAGLECKNTSYGKEWENEQIPVSYQIQGNHYMAVTGANKWYFAVLIDGWDFQWRIIERDEKLIKNLIKIEETFWYNHVLAKQPPAFSANDTEILDGMYPYSKPTRVEISEVYYELVKNLIDSKERLEVAKNEYEDAKNKIKSIMGENELAFWQGEKLCSWKSDKNGKRRFNILGGI